MLKDAKNKYITHRHVEFTAIEYAASVRHDIRIKGIIYA